MEVKASRALVTGASRGMGRAIALALAREGAACVGIGYRMHAGDAKALAIEVQSLGARPILLAGDLTLQAEAEGLVRRFLQEAGGIDVLVNNAGAPAPGRIDQISPEDWDRGMRLLVYAPFWCTRIAAPVMMAQRKGRIINFSSIVARRGIANNVCYVTGKAAVIGFTMALARELADHNVLVAEVAPGLIETEFNGPIDPEVQRKNNETRIPLHRYGTPEEIAESVLFLVRQEYMTGEVLAMDGGFGMRLA